MITVDELKMTAIQNERGQKSLELLDASVREQQAWAEKLVVDAGHLWSEIIDAESPIDKMSERSALLIHGLAHVTAATGCPGHVAPYILSCAICMYAEGIREGIAIGRDGER